MYQVSKVDDFEFLLQYSSTIVRTPVSIMFSTFLTSKIRF